MRILAIADRPPSKSIAQLVQETQPDLICTLGDLEGGDLRGLDAITWIPKIGVYGNHCSGNYFGSLGILDLHLKTFEYRGITFGGFQGCVRYKENPLAIMYTQEESSAMLRDFPRVDVMLAHCPPYGVNDDPADVAHTGYVGLRTYVEEKGPSALLHGHTYPEKGKETTRLGGTDIFYVYRERLMELALP